MSAVNESGLSKVCRVASKIAYTTSKVLLGALIVAGFAAAIFAAIATTVPTGGLPFWLAFIGTIGTTVATGAPVTMFGLTMSFTTLVWGWAGVTAALGAGIHYCNSRTHEIGLWNCLRHGPKYLANEAKKKRDRENGELERCDTVIVQRHAKFNPSITEHAEHDVSYSSRRYSDYSNSLSEPYSSSESNPLSVSSNNESEYSDDEFDYEIGSVPVNSLADKPLNPTDDGDPKNAFNDPRNAFSDEGLRKQFGVDKAAAMEFVQAFNNEAGINQIRKGLGQGPVQAFLAAMN
jgi:hypothetical protein